MFGVLFAAVDFVWLKLTGNFYQKKLHGLLRSQPNIPAAVMFYIVYSIGIVYFVPMWSVQPYITLLVLGNSAMFGFVAYGVYDLTNLATLKKWSIKLAIFDMLWGAFVTSLVALLVFSILRWWL